MIAIMLNLWQFTGTVVELWFTTTGFRSVNETETCVVLTRQGVFRNWCPLWWKQVTAHKCHQNTFFFFTEKNQTSEFWCLLKYWKNLQFIIFQCKFFQFFSYWFCHIFTDMLVTSAQFQTANTLFTIPTPGHVTPAAAASSDCRGIFLRKILSVSHHSQNVKSQPRPGISGLTCSHFCAQRSESDRGSSRAVNKWGLMLLKSNHMIYSSICSGHLLELEITRRPIGVSLVTRHSVTLLLVVLLCGKQLNHRATKGDPLFFSVSFFFFGVALSCELSSRLILHLHN